MSCDYVRAFAHRNLGFSPLRREFPSRAIVGGNVWGVVLLQLLGLIFSGFYECNLYNYAVRGWVFVMKNIVYFFMFFCNFCRR